MKTTLAVIGVIRNNKGNYLLTKRHEPKKEFHGYWHLPGGAVDEKESPETAIIREIKEETGLHVSIEHMIPRAFTQFRKSLWKGIFLCYVLKMTNINQRVILNDEASEYGWFTPYEVHKLKKLSLSSEIISEAIKSESIQAKK